MFASARQSGFHADSSTFQVSVDSTLPIHLSHIHPSTMRQGLSADAFLLAVVGDNFPPTFVPVGTRPLAEDTAEYLHPVIDMEPRVAIDYDGDAMENVSIDGGGSHTHEFGEAVVSYEFKVGDETVHKSDCEADDEDACDRDFDHSLSVGHHDVKLTIKDSSGHELSTTTPIAVVPLERVPGCSMAIYTPSDADDMSSWLKSSVKSHETLELSDDNETLEPVWITSSVVATAAFKRTLDGDNAPYKSCDLIPLAQGKGLVDKKFKKNLIVRAQGVLEVFGGSDSVTLVIEGGDNAIVWVDDEEHSVQAATGSISLLIPSADVNAKFGLMDKVKTKLKDKKHGGDSHDIPAQDDDVVFARADDKEDPDDSNDGTEDDQDGDHQEASPEDGDDEDGDISNGADEDDDNDDST